MIKVLFVCMGNICRSPSAEAVMNKLVKRSGLQDKIQCDSAGTIAYHEGEPADPRMKRHAIKRGYKLTSIARRFRELDFDNFNYVIAMDDSNLRDLRLSDRTGNYSHKIYLMTDFSDNGYFEVPDPYYGGPDGFEMVLDILEDSCQGLLNTIRKEHSL